MTLKRLLKSALIHNHSQTDDLNNSYKMTFLKIGSFYPLIEAVKIKDFQLYLYSTFKKTYLDTFWSRCECYIINPYRSVKLNLNGPVIIQNQGTKKYRDLVRE